MVSADWTLKERDRDVDDDDFIVPLYRDVNDTDGAEESEPETESAEESESETESAEESENDDQADWERIMNLMIRIGDRISRAQLSPP